MPLSRTRLPAGTPRGAIRTVAIRCVVALCLATLAMSPTMTAPAAVANLMDAPASSVSVFGTAASPRSAAASESASVTLGLRFTPKVAGALTAIRFYRHAETKGPHTGNLWDARGNLLATIRFPRSSVVGWHTAELSKPVQLQAGREYLASYRAPQGRYAADVGFFERGLDRPHLTVPQGAGVYSYATNTMPRNNYRNTNYYVDVEFIPAGSSKTSKPISAPEPTPTSPSAGASGPGWTVNASNVGLAPHGLSCAQLPVYSGGEFVPRGTVISGQRISSMLNLSAGSITIERSCIQPTSVGRGLPAVTTTNNNKGTLTPTRVVIRDSEFDGSLLSKELAAYSTGFIGIADLSRNYIHGFGSGIAIMNAGSTLDSIIERNYVTGLVAWGNGATTGNHSDAFTVRDFTAAERANRSLVIRQNRFDCDSGNDTGALFIQTFAGRIDNVLVEENLLEGRGYQLALEQTNSPYSNMRAVNNRFSGTGWGSAYVAHGPGWAQWKNNHIYNSHSPDGQGVAVRQP